MKKICLLASFLLLAFSVMAKVDYLCDSIKDVIGNEAERVDDERAQQHLSEAIQIRTVSQVDESIVEWEEFERFHAFLEQAYPLTHQTLRREKVSKASLLYTWQGTREDLDPIALLAHMDVVPAEDDGNLWQYPPFSGFNDGQFIWGRGALDMKNFLICIMEAVESLLEEGYVPERTVYLCFGHNEETAIGEESGAKAIVETLKNRNVHLESTIDEGGAILPIDIKGVLHGNLVGIGIAEKGFANIKITVHADGGHASQPPKSTAAGKLAKVVRDLERHPFEPQMLTIVDNMFRTIGKNVEFPARWLALFMLDFQPLFFTIACQFPPGASFLRTTMACTMLKGSPSPNVLPEEASVTLDCRLLPGTTAQDVERHIRKVVKDKDIDIEFVRCKETTAISPVDSKAFSVLTELSQQREGKNIVAPYLVMGRTDSFHYEAICENIYRYSPFLVPTSLLLTTHAANERCPIDQLGESIRFYKTYIKKMTE